MWDYWFWPSFPFPFLSTSFLLSFFSYIKKKINDTQHILSLWPNKMVDISYVNYMTQHTFLSYACFLGLLNLNKKKKFTFILIKFQPVPVIEIFLNPLKIVGNLFSFIFLTNLIDMLNLKMLNRTGTCNFTKNVSLNGHSKVS